MSAHPALKLLQQLPHTHSQNEFMSFQLSDVGILTPLPHPSWSAAPLRGAVQEGWATLLESHLFCMPFILRYPTRTYTGCSLLACWNWSYILEDPTQIAAFSALEPEHNIVPNRVPQIANVYTGAPGRSSHQRVQKAHTSVQQAVVP
jgi:hypothetical protein